MKALQWGPRIRNYCWSFEQYQLQYTDGSKILVAGLHIILYVDQADIGLVLNKCIICCVLKSIEPGFTIKIWYVAPVWKETRSRKFHDSRTR